MDIMDRVNIMKECGMTTETSHNDLIKIIEILTNKGVQVTEENTGVMIAHFGAAFNRNITGESVNPLSRELIEQITEEECFDKCTEIFDEITKNITNVFNPTEKEFALLHICTLLNT